VGVWTACQERTRWVIRQALAGICQKDYSIINVHRGAVHPASVRCGPLRSLPPGEKAHQLGREAMTANRSMRSLRRAALGAMVLAMAFPALADEPGSQAHLAAVLGPVGAYPLTDAELDAYRGTGLLDAFAAVIAALPPGYTALVQIGDTEPVGEIGQSDPQSVTVTSGGTTATATATSTTTTSITSTSSFTSTSTGSWTFSF